MYTSMANIPVRVNRMARTVTCQLNNNHVRKMKRQYQRATTTVVALQHEQHLLSGSNGMSGEISGYEQSGGGFIQDPEDE